MEMMMLVKRKTNTLSSKTIRENIRNMSRKYTKKSDQKITLK